MLPDNAVWFSKSPSYLHVPVSHPGPIWSTLPMSFRSNRLLHWHRRRNSHPSSLPIPSHRRHRLQTLRAHLPPLLTQRPQTVAGCHQHSLRGRRFRRRIFMSLSWLYAPEIPYSGIWICRINSMVSETVLGIDGSCCSFIYSRESMCRAADLWAQAWKIAVKLPRVDKQSSYAEYSTFSKLDTALESTTSSCSIWHRFRREHHCKHRIRKRAEYVDKSKCSQPLFPSGILPKAACMTSSER